MAPAAVARQFVQRHTSCLWSLADLVEVAAVGDMNLEPPEPVVPHRHSLVEQEQGPHAVVALEVEVRNRIDTSAPVTVDRGIESSIAKSLSRRHILREQYSITCEATVVLLMLR